MALQPFVGPWPLFQFLDLFTQLVGLLGWGISPSQGRYLHTGQHKHRINAHRRPCLKWDSNTRSQCLSGQRQFMPQTARSLWSAGIPITQRKYLDESSASPPPFHCTLLRFHGFALTNLRHFALYHEHIKTTCRFYARSQTHSNVASLRRAVFSPLTLFYVRNLSRNDVRLREWTRRLAMLEEPRRAGEVGDDARAYADRWPLHRQLSFGDYSIYK
jgi:hypothetical protein